jgi:hypothetical protein
VLSAKRKPENRYICCFNFPQVVVAGWKIPIRIDIFLKNIPYLNHIFELRLYTHVNMSGERR